MPDILKLIAGKPEVVALQFETGKRVESQFGGEQALYTLCDGRRLYAPISLADRIEKDLRVGRNEPIQIVKREVGTGKDKRVTYDVARIAPTAPESVQTPRSGTTQPAFAKQVQHDSLRSAHNTQPPLMTQTASALAGALCAAIEAVMETERYAERRGFAFQFTSEDVRALAITCFISASRDGR